MHRLAAAAVVFLASAAVLVLEILAGRLLAQYVGISLETFTGIIGTVLAGIALGSWAGGALADRVPPRRMLGPLVGLGGLAALATVPVVRVLGPSFDDGSGPSIVALTAAGFFAPAAVLSAVTPTVVKLQLADLGETGSVVGRLSAIGTAGALVGTYLTGFVLVAAASTSTVITILGVGLVVLGLGLTLWLAPTTMTRTGATASVSLAVAGSVLSLGLEAPCDVESAYHCARVVEDDRRPGGRLLLLDTARNSYVDLDDPTHLQFRYARTMGAVIDAWAPDRTLDALHVGGGGFTMAGWLRATRPGSTSVVLEIDPALVEIGEDELGLRTGPDLQVRTGDARITARELADGDYDLVIGDAFTGFSVPWHLTTREFVADIDRLMAPGAVYLMNIIDAPPSRFVRAEVATLLEVFEHVAVLGEPAKLAGADGGNFVLVGSQDPIIDVAVEADLATLGVGALVGADVVAFAEPGDVLRDDFAPVDQWRS